MHDVIVIGAGPAGNIAALRLAEQGHKVAVLDWRRDVGDKLCTGIIGKECADRFPPEKSHVYQEANAATLVTPERARYRVAREEPQAFILNRVSYVNSFAERAVQAGADYELGQRVVNIEVSNAGVAVHTRDGNGQGRHNAKIVIMASGFRSPLLSMVGLSDSKNDDYLVGAQAEVLVSDLEETEVYLGAKVAPGSFGWLVPLSDSRALIGLVSRQKLDGQLNGFIADLQSEGKLREVTVKPRQWGIPVRPLPKTYANRVLVAGDSAGLVKPTTGGGIYYALVSGELAAVAAHEALGAGEFSSNRLKGYEREWKSVFGKELRIGYYARVLYEALDDQQIERLLNEILSSELFSEMIESRDFSFDWHSRLILKAVRHPDMFRVLRSLGPAIAPFLSRLGAARFS